MLTYLHNCILAYMHTCILAYLNTCTCILAYLHSIYCTVPKLFGGLTLTLTFTLTFNSTIPKGAFTPKNLLALKGMDTF